MTNSGWLARAKHCTVIQILYHGYSVLKDGRWAQGGRALQAARRAGAGPSGRGGVRSRRSARQAGLANDRRAGW